MRILVTGVSVRAMAESAVQSGYSVTALDAFGDQDLRKLAEAHSLHHDFHCQYSSRALYEAGRQLDFDSVAYTSNLENHPEVLDCFSEGHQIIGNSPEVLREARCWRTLIPKVRQAGFSVPDTVFHDNDAQPDKNRAWLVKPVLSGGGHGISFLPGDYSTGPQFLLQEYISGVPCSASFVADGRECVVIGITEQLIGVAQLGADRFRYCGSILPYPDPDWNVLQQVRELAAFLTCEFQLVGVNGIDFILKGDRIFLTEINPRYSASMELIERAYGLPVFQWHVKSVLERLLPAFKLENFQNTQIFFGKGILFACSDAAAPDTGDWANRGVRDIPRPGERLRQGSPICTILAGKPSRDDTFAELISRASMLRKEIYG
jgi:uncharacterized protein